MRTYLIAAVVAVAAVIMAAAGLSAAAAAPAGTPAGPASTLYVDNQISGTVTPISIATNTPGKAIRAGSGPTNLEITPNGKTLYAVDSFARIATVTPISTATNKPGKPIKVGEFPCNITITPE